MNIKQELIKSIIPLIIIMMVISGCKNEEISSGDSIYSFREIHEDIHWGFDEITLGGSRYYILERDRNNPHEGFGFMALNGDKITARQDSILALMKTNIFAQAKILAKLNGTSVDAEYEQLMLMYDSYLDESYLHSLIE